MIRCPICKQFVKKDEPTRIMADSFEGHLYPRDCVKAAVGKCLEIFGDRRILDSHTRTEVLSEFELKGRK